ncbi:MAG: hypothetical protein ABEH80_07120 [Halobaculum sp.]
MTESRHHERGQATLVSLTVAVVFLVAGLTVALGAAATAFAGAQRAPVERHAAATAGERLVAADSPLTRRANVLNASAVEELTAERVRQHVPTLAETSFRVRLGDRTVVERGTPRGGVTVRRIVLVARQTPRTREVNATTGITLPRRTGRLRLGFDDATVRRVRVDGRVVLARSDGLRGTATVPVSRLATLRVTFDPAARGTVTVTTFPARTRKRLLVVTVDE